MLKAVTYVILEKNVPLERMGKAVADNSIFDKDFILVGWCYGNNASARKEWKLGTVPETLNITKPDWIIDIHKQLHRCRFGCCLRQYFWC